MDKQRTIELIISHEGFNQFLYNDLNSQRFSSENGKLTIGYGYNIEERGLPLSICKELLIQDVNDLISRMSNVAKIFPELDSVRQAILIDMAYNMGINGLCKFKDMLSNVDNKKFEKAASDMTKSLWAIQVKTRAYRLSNMMITGQWPDGI